MKALELHITTNGCYLFIKKGFLGQFQFALFEVFLSFLFSTRRLFEVLLLGLSFGFTCMHQCTKQEISFFFWLNEDPSNGRYLVQT